MTTKAIIYEEYSGLLSFWMKMSDLNQIQSGAGIWIWHVKAFGTLMFIEIINSRPGSLPQVDSVGNNQTYMKSSVKVKRYLLEVLMLGGIQMGQVLFLLIQTMKCTSEAYQFILFFSGISPTRKTLSYQNCG